MELFKSWLVEKYVAHRGLHDEQSAENSLSAFEKAIENAVEVNCAVLGNLMFNKLPTEQLLFSTTAVFRA